MKTRSEMDPRFTWDFTDMFKTEEAMVEDYHKAEKLIEELPKYYEDLEKSKDAFKLALDKTFEVSKIVEIVYIYAMLHLSADSSDSHNQELDANATNLYVKLSMATSTLMTRVIKMDDAVIEKFMAEDDMATYRHTIEDARRAKAHTLTEDMEVLLAKLGDFAQAPSNAFHMFNDSDIRFNDVKNEKGEISQLTNGNFGVYRQSKSREVRKEAFETFFGEYKKYVNTIASLYSSNVKYDNFIADVKNYDSAAHMALFAHNVPLSVYENLVESVHNNLDGMRDYLELRKKLLKTEDIDMFDLYVPMIDGVEMNMDFEEAKVLVKEALKPLGDDYQKMLQTAFDNKWMDVYENQGKRTGAFSCGVYGVHPYVLLNFTGQLNDAFTMAHELGHSMHSYYSDKTQDFVNHDYAIFVAEVASTTNEVLMTLHLLETVKDKATRAYILNDLLESFRTTMFRQTLFAEFEYIAHTKAQNGEALTAGTLNGIYHDLISKYYDGIGIPDIMSYEWAYIPHFYTSFYVYQYATGFASACAIAKHIKETGDTAGYLKFLSLGGSCDPIDALKVAGVDLTKPDAVNDALKLFKDTVAELTELVNEL